MSEKQNDNMATQTERKTAAADFATRIGNKATRKLQARANTAAGVWFGLGMMGLIGWSVVIPTLLGAALGLWIDKHFPGAHSWTLALLMAGLTLGCYNAWHWVDKEARTLQKQENQKQENQKQENQEQENEEEENHDGPG